MRKINGDMDNMNVKDPSAYVVMMEEKYKRKEELYEKVHNEIKPLIQMDTTIETDSRLTFSNEHLEQDEKFLRDLSKFLKEDLLSKFLNDISKDEDGTPSDCFSLTEALHKFGINVRYYGELLKLIDNDQNMKKQSSWVKSLIVRDIFRRSAKHIFNELVSDIPEYLIKDFTAHFLNIFLSPSSSIKSLESFDLAYKDTITNVKPDIQNTGNVSSTTANIPTENVSDKKKKKKNKNKKKKTQKDIKTTEIEMDLRLMIGDNLQSKNVNSLCELKDLKEYLIKPSQFWNKIREIALQRYNHTIPEKVNFDYIDPVLNKFGLLRDFCLTVGLQIEATDYDLYYDSNYSSKNEFKYTQMPFKPENMVDFFPVVKDYILPSEIHKPIYDQADALFRSGNFLEASDKLKQLIYLSNEVYGQINFYSGMAHKKLGEISYLEGDYMNGIVMLQKAIVIFEKLYDYDTNIVASAYTELSQYYHLMNQDFLAFKYIYRGLEILNFTYPKNHPELVNRMCSLAMYYVDIDLIENAKELVESSIKVFANFFEEDDRNVYYFYLYFSCKEHGYYLPICH